MTHAQILAVVNNIYYKPGWMVELYAKPVEYSIRLSWFDTDSVTGKKELQHSREWLLDPAEELNEDKIVQTVFKAIQNAEEHEIKERFRYKGKRIFNPHISLKNLLEVCEREDNV